MRHNNDMRFAKGALQRQLDARALSHRDFAKIAKVSPTTVLKGCKGNELAKKSGSRILIALSAIPILATDNLEVAL